MQTPYVGLRFEHRSVLDGHLPAHYIVTAIRDGVIYYKQPLEKKAKEYCTLEGWPRVCARAILYKSRE